MKWKLRLLLFACMIVLLTMIIEAAAIHQGDRSPEEKNTDSAAAAETDANSRESMKRANAKLLYMGQASIRITTAEGKVIYIDPYAGDGYEPAADLILVTHGHACSTFHGVYGKYSCTAPLPKGTKEE